MEVETHDEASSRRSAAWRVLDNPLLWEASRIALDASFGLYRRRLALLREWGVLDGSPSVLDIGCGIGQYAAITDGRYLGVDLNERYVNYARRRRGGPTREFRSADVTEISQGVERFDLVLMVDFLHHIPAEACVELLTAAAGVCDSHVVSFEPVTSQPNRVGRWIVEHDRGDYVRTLDELEGLFARAGLTEARSTELRLGPISTRAILASPADRG